MTAATSHDMSEIGDIAGSLRLFLEPKWCEWKSARGKPVDAYETPSLGMCGFTSVFVADALSRTVGGNWSIAGGRPNAGGGLTCRQGRQNGHFWAKSDDGVIVDLTADQFGLPAVIVTRADDLRFVPSFTESDIEEHLPRVQPIALDWLEQAADEGLLPSNYYKY